MFSTFPHAFVASAIRIRVDTIAFFFVIHILTLIHTTIWPFVVAVAVHIVFFPEAFIDSSVFPIINAVTCDLVVLPRASEFTSVGPGIDSVAMLHAVFIMADISCSVSPSLLTFSLLHIIYPFTFISTAIDMSINSTTTSLILLEVAYIDVSFCVPKYSLSFGLIFHPIALIDSAINPFLNSIPASFISRLVIRIIHHHLPFVHASIWKLMQLHLLQTIHVVPKIMSYVVKGLVESILLVYSFWRIFHCILRHWISWLFLLLELIILKIDITLVLVHV